MVHVYLQHFHLPNLYGQPLAKLQFLYIIERKETGYKNNHWLNILNKKNWLNMAHLRENTTWLVCVLRQLTVT